MVLVMVWTANDIKNVLTRGFLYNWTVGYNILRLKMRLQRTELKIGL